MEVAAMDQRTSQARVERQPFAERERARFTARYGALRIPGERPDRFAIATVIGRRNARSAALLADVEPEAARR
jgi:hypothetical protein